MLVSDAAAAVSEILPDGGLRRIGKAGGEPNGLAPIPDGSIVIANFASGVLQRLDPASGAIDVLLDELDGQPLGAVNYPVVDRAGAIWVSGSTRTDPVATIASGRRTASSSGSIPTGRRRRRRGRVAELHDLRRRRALPLRVPLVAV